MSVTTTVAERRRAAIRMFVQKLVKEAVSKYKDKVESKKAENRYRSGLKGYLGVDPKEDLINYWKENVRTKGVDRYKQFVETLDEETVVEWFKNYFKAITGREPENAILDEVRAEAVKVLREIGKR